MFLRDYCTFQSLSEKLADSLQHFDCGHADLNDFFANECFSYSRELIGKTYCFTLDSDPEEIVCAFTIANDSIKVNTLPNSRRKKLLKEIPREKRMRSYPAVLIGRLGVSIKHKSKGVGRELEEQEKAYMSLSDADKLTTRLLYFDLIVLKA